MHELPQILDRGIVVDTEHFRIERLHLKFSNGQIRYYERMAGGGSGAVMIVPVMGDEIILVREYCAGTNSYELGFPKGKSESGESWQQTADRELREETGYSAMKYTFLRSVNSAPSFFEASIDLVLAEDLEEKPLDTGDEPEPIEIVRWPLSNISALFSDPNFREARCLAALFAAASLRGWLRLPASIL
jgi:ADP-ribose diphosphatase